MTPSGDDTDSEGSKSIRSAPKKLLVISKAQLGSLPTLSVRCK